jgi:nitrite reductase (NADH) small subunit
MSALQARDGAAMTWLRIGRPSDIPHLEGRSIQIGERRVAVFCLPDGWAAIDHACPHKAGPLSDGIVAEGCVTCPLHGQRFSLQSGERLDGEGRGVLTYEVRERNGELELLVPEADLLRDAA